MWTQAIDATVEGGKGKSLDTGGREGDVLEMRSHLKSPLLWISLFEK